MRVKHVCIVFRITCNAQNIEELHRIVIDYKYFLHGLPVDSDYHNWVLSEFSYKHSFFLYHYVHVCIFGFN
ncbi:hypothetical protein ACB092_11G097000 [Castanea dentata]